MKLKILKEMWEEGVLQFIGGLMGLIFSVVILLALAGTYFKVKSYNEITGNNVSYWQGFFVELKVYGEPIVTKP